MPHYQDGTPVQVGDIARGKGSNHPYPVQGVVVGVTPSASACNIQVAIAKSELFPINPDLMTQNSPANVSQAKFLAKLDDGRLLPVCAQIEYGTCSDFELVHRPTAKDNGALQ